MAVKDGRLPANPAHGLNLPKVSKSSKRYLTHAEVRDLADAVDALGRGIYRGQPNGYGLLVLVLAYCGLRWGEASGLRVKDIDFKRGRLEIQHTIVEIDGVQIDSEPKDYEARSIPVPATILAELKTHVEGEEAGSPVFAAARGWVVARTSVPSRLAGRSRRNHRSVGTNTSRIAPHRSKPRERRRRKRQSGPADAWARISRRNAGRVFGSVRQRP